MTRHSCGPIVIRPGYTLEATRRCRTNTGISTLRSCGTVRAVAKNSWERKMKIDLIVSRHPAAVEFVRQELGISHDLPLDVPVLASATADDVRGRVVAGNLPLHLAAAARELIAIEFTGDAPRGREYGVAEMRAAGARLHSYIVEDLDEKCGCSPLERLEAEEDRRAVHMTASQQCPETDLLPYGDEEEAEEWESTD